MRTLYAFRILLCFGPKLKLHVRQCLDTSLYWWVGHEEPGDTLSKATERI